MKSGRLWVLGIFAVASALGLFAAFHWSRPESQVRGSFTQVHVAIIRGRRDAAARLIADPVTLDGRALSREEFLAAYTPVAPKQTPEISPCPAATDHWRARSGGRAWCFVRDGRLWKMHHAGPDPCDCR